MESAVTHTKPAVSEVAERLAEGEAVSFEVCNRAAVPVADVLARIGSKWTVYIIGSLTRGPKRFSELKREVEGISQKVLTATLRDLEEDGFVTRTVTPSIPPRVDYELTAMGRELRKPLAAIGEWAHANRERVVESRERYAQREAKRRAESW